MSAPAVAWLAAYGGWHGGVAVGVHPGCCYHAYGGAAVAGTAVAGMAVGAAVASTAYYPPAPVYVAPAPVYGVPAPAYGLPVGTVVYQRPGGCQDAEIGGLSYSLCGGFYY